MMPLFDSMKFAAASWKDTKGLSSSRRSESISTTPFPLSVVVNEGLIYRVTATNRDAGIPAEMVMPPPGPGKMRCARRADFCAATDSAGSVWRLFRDLLDNSDKRLDAAEASMLQNPLLLILVDGEVGQVFGIQKRRRLQYVIEVGFQLTQVTFPLESPL